jgi:hypothetical protein
MLTSEEGETELVDEDPELRSGMISIGVFR